jgi:hypothetical protein
MRARGARQKRRAEGNGEDAGSTLHPTQLSDMAGRAPFAG